MSILLTGLEIKHLAESAGFLIDPQSIDFGELEAEHTIEKCDGKGVIDDDGNVQHFNYVTRCEGCDSGECTPLGNPIIGESESYD